MAKTRIKYEFTDGLQNSDEGCIYKITNLINGKVYIGQSINFKNRMYYYNGSLAKGQNKLHNAFKKYGINNFIMEQIAFGKKGEDLDNLEVFNITSYDSIKNGYNCESGGTNGYSHSAETRRKLSEARKGRVISEETRRKISESLKGAIVSQATRDKIGKKSRGRVFSQESKQKMRESHLGNSHKQESKDKISKGLRQAYTDGLRSLIVSEDTKAKISNTLMGHIPPNRLCVNQYTKDGEFIKSHESLTAAANSINRSCGLLCMCLKGKCEFAGGFKWEYEENKI